MGDGPISTEGGAVAGQVAEIIAVLEGEPGRRGSGYRVGPTAVLTAAHVTEGAVSVRVRFDADLPGEWITEVISCWSDPSSDLAVLTIAPRQGEPPVTVARFGRIGGDRAAVLAVQAVGFPRFKLKTDDDAAQLQYRDSHQADGSVAVLSNRRERTLEVTVPPPERDPDPDVSPWEGMSGAAVWIGGRIVGVIAKHHRCDGLGRLAAARLDLALAGLDQGQRAELRTLLDLPDALPDVVPPSTGEWVRTAYQAQVRDIAPDCLFDRDAELDELVGFCAGDQPYAWWQAGPWAGKSALMAWFVLHPPAGVDVVSFFVTARLAGQSDSNACTDALIEQLAALLGEPPASLLTARARRGTMLQLLENAASQAREAGRRLLLVIDGLDEDSGTATGPSIAALLPRRPPPEVRVLVASRPHPPIPDDVTDDHLLRTISPRQLDVSEHARDVERRAKHELTQLLAGEQLQRDVLGLMTAAGGGLTLADLEQLTERPPYEIRRLLGGVFGRSIGNRISRPSAGYPDERVYLFTHETLRLVAEQQYGASLAAYRDRLHTWADSYKQRCWPADTPRYLLRSYPRMLTSSEDLPRLVACATDQTRHDRMRDLTGGDALAFTEISTAQQLILAQPDPDLTSLALLAVQREHLTDRNSSIPDNLPVVWVMLGQPTRAEALANSIPDPSRRTLALEQLAKVLAAAGDHGRAESLATQITYPYQLANALAGIARAADHFDDLDRAARLAAEIEALVGLLTHPFEQAGASQELARLTAAAEDLAVQITDVGLRGQVLIRLAEVLARGGDHSHAARLATEVETLAAQKIDPVVRERAWACLVEALAISGDLERAEAITGRLTDPLQRTGALQALVEATAASGDLDKAQALIAQLIPGQRGWPLPALIKAAVTVGDLDRAEALIELIELDTDPFQQLRAFLPLLRAAGGHRDRATRLATQAEILAGQITDPYVRVHALAGLAGTAGASGDDDRAARLASEGEDLTEKISDPYLRLQVLVGLIGAGGDGAARLAARAEALAAQISDPDWKTQALIRLAEIVAAGGDYDRATRLAAEAEALSMQITNPWLRMVVLTELMGMVGARGDDDWAARLAAKADAVAAQVTDADRRARSLSLLAMTLLGTIGNTSSAREDAHGSSPALVRVRRLLAEALVTASWTNVVVDLARVDPAAVSTLAGELRVRWGFDAPNGP